MTSLLLSLILTASLVNTSIGMEKENGEPPHKIQKIKTSSTPASPSGMEEGTDAEKNEDRPFLNSGNKIQFPKESMPHVLTDTYLPFNLDRHDISLPPLNNPPLLLSPHFLPTPLASLNRGNEVQFPKESMPKPNVLPDVPSPMVEPPLFFRPKPLKFFDGTNIIGHGKFPQEILKHIIQFSDLQSIVTTSVLSGAMNSIVEKMLRPEDLDNKFFYKGQYYPFVDFKKKIFEDFLSSINARLHTDSSVKFFFETSNNQLIPLLVNTNREINIITLEFITYSQISFKNCEYLKILTIKSSKLDIFELPYKLEKLELIDCPEISIPSLNEIGNLKKLVIKNCNLREVATLSIRGNNSLERVYLPGNNLTEIPKDTLPNKVKRLNLSKNKLTEVPPDILTYLYKIEWLSLKGNNISSIESLKELLNNAKSLKIVKLGGNPLGDADRAELAELNKQKKIDIRL